MELEGTLAVCRFQLSLGSVRSDAQSLVEFRVLDHGAGRGDSAVMG